MTTISEHNFPNKSLAKTAKKKVQNVRAAGSPDINQLRQVIPIGGRLLASGNFIELVRVRGHELVLHGEANQFTIVPEFVDGNCSYAPSGAADAVRHLPSKPVQFHSTEGLFASVTEFIATHTGLDEEETTLLAFVAFSSFFYDCLSPSPCLLLFGAPFAAVSLLGVLSCVTRHPILSVGSSVDWVPAELRPTRLICQPDARLERQLAALQFPVFEVFKAQPQQVSGTTVIYVGDRELKNPFAQHCLQLWLSPAVRGFGLQEEEQAGETILKLQNQMLAYRLKNFTKVRTSNFDVAEFSGATREYARSMGRCMVHAPELQSQLTTLLRERDDAERAESAGVLDAVIIEALAVCCHERKPSVRVAEVATLANGILSRSGEAIELSPKQVGGRMKSLGFRTTRLDASGRGIYLLNGECARVHKLGRALGVPMFREGLPGCPYCEQR